MAKEPSCGKETTEIKRLILEAQQHGGQSPVHFISYRAVKNQGEIPFVPVGEYYSIGKTYDLGYYSPGPFPTPLFNFSKIDNYRNGMKAVCDHQPRRLRTR